MELSSVLLVVAALFFLETHILSLLTTRFIVRNGLTELCYLVYDTSQLLLISYSTLCAVFTSLT